MFTTPRLTHSTSAKGATLIELVVTVVVAGIIGSVLSKVLMFPFTMMVQADGRSHLMHEATLLAIRMQHDLDGALPRSVRVTASGTRSAMEHVQVAESLRYHGPENTLGAGRLDTGTPDTSFEVYGQLSTNLSASSHSLVVHHSNTESIYDSQGRTSLSNVATAGSPPHTGTDNTIFVNNPDAASDPINDDRITLGAGHTFPSASPSQTLFVVDGAVSYVCDTADGTLTRYSGYELSSSGAQPINSSEFNTEWTTGTPVVSGVLSKHISACNWSVDSQGDLSLQITLSAKGQDFSIMQHFEVPSDA